LAWSSPKPCGSGDPSSQALPAEFPGNFLKRIGIISLRPWKRVVKNAIHLLDRPQEARKFGMAGAENVRAHFLLPRLVRDELRLLCELLNA
jgi:trehalose synthase